MPPITGQRIKMERLRYPLSQDELAEKLGFKRTNIANYEAGRVTPPSDVIAKLSKIFNVSSDYLLGLDDVENIGPSLLEEMKEQELLIIELSAATGAYPSEIQSCVEENAPISETLLRRIVKEFGMSMPEFFMKYDLFDGAIPPQFDGELAQYAHFQKAVEKDAIETIAAHHDGEEWTEEELQEIEQFKEFVRMKKRKKEGM